MKLKSFEDVGKTPEELAAEAETKAVEEKKSIGAGVKIDRRQKLAPKADVEVGPGDVVGDYGIMEAAREELAREGNKNPTLEEIKSRARMGVFSTMHPEEEAQRVIDALSADPESARKISEKTTTGLKTEFVISEARRKKQEYETEQERKREEVERVRKITSEKTAAVIKAAKEAKGAKETKEERVKEESGLTV